MNRGRVALWVGAGLFVASLVVFYRAEQLADEVRSLRAAEASAEDDIGDVFVLSHAPDNGDQLDTGPDGFDSLSLFAPTIDDLTATLLLSPDQTAGVREIVDATNQRIRQLLETPDERGRTPQAEIDRRRELARRILEAYPQATESVRVYVRPVEFRDWRIEGRGTYDEEITRLTGEAREKIHAQLGKEQRERFMFADIRCLFPVPDGTGEAE